MRMRSTLVMFVIAALVTGVLPVAVAQSERIPGDAPELGSAEDVQAMIEGYQPAITRPDLRPQPSAEFAVAAAGAEHVEGSLVVTLADGVAEDAWLASASLPSATIEARRVATRVVQVVVPPGDVTNAVEELLALRGVQAVEPDFVRQFLATPNDPSYDIQWPHQLTDIERAWDRRTGIDGNSIAIIDTGIDARNAEIGSIVIDQQFTGDGTLEPGTRPDNDPCGSGHGTAVAGVAAAIGNNGEALSGVIWGDAQVIDMSVFTTSGCGATDVAVGAALDYLANLDQPPLVANMSLGGIASGCPSSYQPIIDAARDAGIFLVAASGNHQQNQPNIPAVPASCNGVFSVGAVGADGIVSTYSTNNEFVDLTAPGGDFADVQDTSDFGELQDNLFPTLCRTEGGDSLCDGETTLIEGTSFAAPYVAGAVALLRAEFPDLTLDEVEAVLEASAEDGGAVGVDPAYGWGLIQVGRAFDLAESGRIPALVADPEFPVDGGGTGPATGVVVRQGPTAGPTDPIVQASEIAQATFAPGSASWAVLARPDDYADGLAGSGVSFALGPILFTNPPGTGTLPAATRDVLQTLLPTGRTVYLMGGTAAIDLAQEQELTGLGYDVVRLAGATREETAAIAGQQIRQFVSEAALSNFPDLRVAIVATRGNWVDAVTAGAMSAYWGLPVLLTSPDSLHPETDGALRTLGITDVLVVGGEAAVGQAAYDQIESIVGSDRILRLGGDERIATSMQIARFTVFLQQSFDLFPEPLLMVNLRRDDGFTHILSASAAAARGLGQGSGGFFVPLEGEDGSNFSDEAQEFSCYYPSLGVAVGGPDVVADSTLQTLQDVFDGSAGSCQISDAMDQIRQDNPTWQGFVDQLGS